jgi:hypothetical protein
VVGDPYKRGLIAALAGLAVGAILHFVAIYLRDYGPSSGSWSFRGNGALIVLPVALLVLLVGEGVILAHRLWIGLVVFPIALFLGMFVIFGSF